MRRAPLSILLFLALLVPALLSAAEPIADSPEFDESGHRIIEPAPPGTLAAALQELYVQLEARILTLESALRQAPTHELRQSLRDRVVQAKDSAQLEALRIRLDFAQREGRTDLAETILAELGVRLNPPDLDDPEARRLSQARSDQPRNEGGSR